MASLRARTPARLARLLGVLSVALIAAASGASSAASAGCTNAYSYAGVVDARRAHGVKTRLTALVEPGVANGHVAAWVGVGGTTAGPAGESEWIQVGYSAFDAGESELYYEIARPGAPPAYTALDLNVSPGETHGVAVLEVAARPGYWRVWLDGRAASGEFFLPGSHRAWRPMAMSESWNAGSRRCNRFAYRFTNVMVATRAGGRWRAVRPGDRLQDPGYSVRPAARGFIALSR